ncbi:MAG: PD-(D/E)XK nuclease family protein [Pseudomonadota bacterium]
MANVFYLPLGASFAEVFATGLAQRLGAQPQSERAQMQVFFNTTRTQRRVMAHLLEDHRYSGFLPRFSRVDEAGPEERLIPALARRLVLARLVRALLEGAPTLAPQSAAFDLAESLAALLDEMLEAGCAPSDIAALEPAEFAEHWQKGALFFAVLAEEWPALKSAQFESAVDPGEALCRRVEAAIAQWQQSPPQAPVIVAGSTGSRPPTHMLLRAVAALPNGAVVLPGVDVSLSEQERDECAEAPEHPQHGISRFLQAVGMTAAECVPWVDGLAAHPRQTLVSNALRPAPVTDQWRAAAPALSRDIAEATQALTLLETTSPLQEADAVAFAMRKAVAEEKTVALVTPDRSLARQVGTALTRWGITPDDSAGQPLHLTAPGVFLRLVAGVFSPAFTIARLVALLRHPLCLVQSEDRPSHLLKVEELEILLAETPALALREGLASIDDPPTEDWADWIAWLQSLFGPKLAGFPTYQPRPLAKHLAEHLSFAERLSGAGGEAEGLWAKTDGAETRKAMTVLSEAAGYSGDITHAEYQRLLDAHLASQTLRAESFQADPRVRIFGTLEARSEAADVMILAGLNDGVWPKLPAPDPWLNLKMRAQLGLASPERQVGLSAHDFQSAIAAREVILSRAVHDGSAPSVASRWLTRLLNLIGGLGDAGGQALEEMRRKGQELTAQASLLDAPIPSDPAPRPAPATPQGSFPKQIFVTQVETLIRDPYAVYARQVLGLKALKKLGEERDARDRGTAFHQMLEAFARQTQEVWPPQPEALLHTLAQEAFTASGATPTQTALWTARLSSITQKLVAHLKARYDRGRLQGAELKGIIAVAGVQLGAYADRIDRRADGRLDLIDYKTGKPPSAKQITSFAKQMPLTGLIAMRGGFTEQLEEIGAIGLQGLNTDFDSQPVPPELQDWDALATEFATLVAYFNADAAAWPARLRPQMITFASDYDHLSRRGEWDDGAAPYVERVGDG